MKYYDCSVALQDGLVTWPGEDGLRRTTLSTLAKDGAEVSEFTIGAHTGTHIDAPSHFVEGGAGIEAYDVNKLIGQATVVDLTQVDWSKLDTDEAKEITPEHLHNTDLVGIERILFKTENSTRTLMDQPDFTTDYVSLSLKTAELLVSHNIKLVGVDYLSVEKKGNPGHPVHVALLSKNIVNIEGVRLIDVPAGTYHLTALPLRIVGADGCPARVILQETT